MATTRKICYPHPKGWQSSVLTVNGKPELHPTRGLAHNWALDFLASGGTPVVAVERGKIFKCSGHRPDDGVFGADVFGWNTYLMTPDGLIYFYTHQGKRYVEVGDKVARGTVIGTVGEWPKDPGRSHTHLGVTFPFGGDAASKRAILNIAKAPRVPYREV